MVLFSEKQKKNKTGHHNDIFRWKRDGFSSENEVTKGILWKKTLETRILKKMNLIDASYQINVTSDHSVSSDNTFKNHLNAKSFNMILRLL